MSKRFLLNEFVPFVMDDNSRILSRMEPGKLVPISDPRAAAEIRLNSAIVSESEANRYVDSPD